MNTEVFHDFRLTFTGQDEDLKQLQDQEYLRACRRLAIRFINRCATAGYFTQCTAGIEMLNKKGENCRLHLHLRFSSSNLTESLRKRLKDWLKQEDQDTFGNRAFMFKAKIVRCEEEFMQYPLKQNLDIELCRGYPEEKLLFMHEVAKASYIKVVEVNQKKTDNRDSTDTLFERVFSNLKNPQASIICERQVMQAFLDMYVKENRPINHTTIQGYTTTACVKLGIIKVEDLLDKWLI